MGSSPDGRLGRKRKGSLKASGAMYSGIRRTGHVGSENSMRTRRVGSWVRTPEKSSARGELAEAIGTERTDGRKTRNLVYDTRGNPAIDTPSHGPGKDRCVFRHGAAPRGNSGFRGFSS